MKKPFHATLNLAFDAESPDEARVIAKACKAVIIAFHSTPHLRAVQPYKVEVEIDDIEEA